MHVIYDSKNKAFLRSDVNRNIVCLKTEEGCIKHLERRFGSFDSKRFLISTKKNIQKSK
jgi:hypothetical protein